jgi:hypothetical protein
MKNIRKLLRYAALMAVMGLLLVLSSCTLWGSYKISTVKFAPGANRSAARAVAPGTKVEFYISGLAIAGGDGNAMSFMGHIAIYDSYNNYKETIVIEGWYDVTTPLSVSVVNGYNTGRYANGLLSINKIRVGGEGGHVFDIEKGGKTLIFYTPNYADGDSAVLENFGGGDRSHVLGYIPFTPFNVPEKTSEFIMSVSVDIDKLLVDATTLQINWWESISLSASAR